MLIDDPVVAVNEVIVACQEVADYYADASNHVDDDNLKSLFNNLAAQRRQAADQLAGIIRDQGGLPRSADIDQEQLQLLWSHLKQTLAGHDDKVLIDDILQQESQLQQITDAALAISVSADSRRIIEQVNADSHAALLRLGDSAGQ